MDKNAIFKRKPDVTEREIDGEAVLLDLGTGMYYSTDEIGTEIWKLLDGARTAKDIADWVVEQYEVEPEAAAADVAELLDDLLGEKLIVQVK